MKQWVVFYGPDGKQLAAYTVEGTFKGELQATKELLAHDLGLDEKDITVKLEGVE